jgi:hypothetical protein
MSERIPRYYEELGWAHDLLLRCKDCQGLVTYEAISSLGCCNLCGNKRCAEITILSEEEMAKIQSGEIDFLHRDKFLAEFNPVGA